MSSQEVVPKTYDDFCRYIAMPHPIDHHFDADLNFDNGFFRIKSLNADSYNSPTLEGFPMLSIHGKMQHGAQIHIPVTVQAVKEGVISNNISMMHEKVRDTLKELLAHLEDDQGVKVDLSPVKTTWRRKTYADSFSAGLSFALPYYDHRVVGAYHGTVCKKVFKMMLRRDLHVVGYRARALKNRPEGVLDVQATACPKFLMDIDGETIIAWLENDNQLPMSGMTNKQPIQELIEDEFFRQWPLSRDRVKITEWMGHEFTHHGLSYALQKHGLLS